MAVMQGSLLLAGVVLVAYVFPHLFLLPEGLGCQAYMLANMTIPSLGNSTVDEEMINEALRKLPQAFRALGVLASCVKTAGIAAAVGLVAWQAIKCLFFPLDIVRPAATVQLPQVTEQLDNRHPGTRFLHLSRRFGHFPPPYPNGWFVLCYSEELRPGRVRNVNVLGGQYVLWRNSRGVPALFDAYCPHMGANLGLGAEVKGDCLTCPFHGWQFDTSGACVSIPYAKEPTNVPTFAKTSPHTIYERNNMIHFWHHSDGHEPEWYPPDVPEINEGRFWYHGKTEHHVLAHIQELPENGADVAHLDALHFPFVVPQLSPWLLQHKWHATWDHVSSADISRIAKKAAVDIAFQPGGLICADTHSAGNVNSHTTHIELVETVQLLGRWHLSFMDIKVVVNQIGPGIVWLRFNTPLGQALVCETVTPYAPMLQRTCHVIYTERALPRFVAKIILYSLAAQYERDVPIWQWKTFPAKPMLTAEDGNIRKFRQWFSQFYTDSSLPFQNALNKYAEARAVMPSSW